MDQDGFELLYASRLTDNVPVQEVGRVVESARRRNAVAGITGALLFDGARFCQLLEGSGAAVLDLMSRILVDPRHCEIVRLHQSPCAIPRFRSWHIGYVQLHDVEAISRMALLRGDAARRAFDELLPRIDFGLDASVVPDPARERGARTLRGADQA